MIRVVVACCSVTLTHPWCCEMQDGAFDELCKVPDANTIEQVEALQSLLARYKPKKPLATDDDDDVADNDNDDDDDEFVRLCVAYSQETMSTNCTLRHHDRISRWCHANGLDLLQIHAQHHEAPQPSAAQVIKSAQLLSRRSDDDGDWQTIEAVRDALVTIPWNNTAPHTTDTSTSAAPSTSPSPSPSTSPSPSAQQEQPSDIPMTTTEKKRTSAEIERDIMTEVFGAFQGATAAAGPAVAHDDPFALEFDADGGFEDAIQKMRRLREASQQVDDEQRRQIAAHVSLQFAKMLGLSE
jgi:hypothetical protein